MSSTKSPIKPRIQRLRASCDGCFLAKVKCSKARPICSRCLTCGADCKYSPSSRAGKPKANRANTTPNMSANVVNPEVMGDSVLSSPFFFDSNAITMAADGKNTPIFTFDTNWSVQSGSTDKSFPGSLSTTATPAIDNTSILNAEMRLPSSNSELFDPSFTWTQNSGSDIDHTIYHVDPSMMLPRSRSTDDVPQLNSFSPWLEGQQNIHFSPCINNKSSPSAIGSPCSSPDFAGHSRTPASPCSCLKTCLQSLLTLHDHSNPAKIRPALDLVLTINRKAVEGCASMIACGNCVSRSGSNTNAMLLATIMEKILSFYQEAIRDYFGTMPGAESQMSIGTYQVTNEDGCWLKAEILWRELRKLDELLGHFRIMCGGHNELDDKGVHSSLVNHLSQSLYFTFEVMKLQQSGFRRLD